MAVDLPTLRTAAGTTAVDDLLLQQCLDLGKDVVDKLVLGMEDQVPLSAYDAAWLAAAVEWFNIKKAPNGVLNQQFGRGEDSTTVAVRIGRDPSKPARAVLSTWISSFGTVL